MSQTYHIPGTACSCECQLWQTLEAALDVLRLCIVLVNQDGRIFYANRAAKVMMQNSGPLRNCCGFLRAEEAKVSAEIKAAIRLAVVQVANGPSAIAVRLTSLNEMAVVAHVLPLIGGETRLHVRPVEAAAIVVNATLDDAACSQTMATTFGLTPAETRVLSQILLGKTVAATAAEVGVAVTTARTHLDSIIMKTGVSRRSELFRLAGRIGPPNL